MNVNSIINYITRVTGVCECAILIFTVFQHLLLFYFEMIYNSYFYLPFIFLCVVFRIQPTLTMQYKRMCLCIDVIVRFPLLFPTESIHVGLRVSKEISSSHPIEFINLR